MKKTMFFIIGMVIGLPFLIQAQNAVDALRYSQMYFGSTARSNALGGAMGALGADFGALSINPASVAVYRKSEFTLSPLLGFNQTASIPSDGSSYTDFQYDFRLANGGLVGVFPTGNESGWISTNIGIGYNVLNQFDQRTSVRILDANSSLLDDFVYDANQNNWAYLWNEVALLSDVIFFDSNAGVYSHDFINSEYGQSIRRTITEKGSNGEYVFSLGANYNNELFLGANLGIQSLRYESTLIHNESNIPDNYFGLSQFTHTEEIDTRGTGVNLKVGAIYTPVYWIRLGASVHSPVFYSLRESYSGIMAASSDSLGDLSGSNSGQFDYEVITPPRLILSTAFVLGRNALVSFDYEMVNYSFARLRSDTYMFDIENEGIQAMYRNTRNLRLGAEYRISAVSLRGGAFYYESPFAEGEINAGSDMLGYSFGFGINNSSYFLDFSYTNRFNQSEYVLYQQPLNIATIESTQHQLLFTLGFRF